MNRALGNAAAFVSIALSLGAACDLAHGAATFVEVVADPAPPADPHIKAAGDLDGDGLIDLFVASSVGGGALAWYEAPDWIRHDLDLSIGGWSTDAEIVDVDLDGDVDIVISQWYLESWIGWLENPGAIEETEWAVHLIGAPRMHDIETSDLDGDGDPDVVTRGQQGDGDEIVIWRQNSPNAWASVAVTCPTGEGLHLTDLSGDGRADAVIGARWYEAPAGDVIEGTWTEHVFAPGWTHLDVRAASGDLDGDGDTDIALSPAEGTYRLSWFEQPDRGPNGTWTEHPIIPSVDGVHSLAIGDVDCDGDLDIAAAAMHQYTNPDFVRVYYNGGAGAAWTTQTLASTGSHNLVLADLGADGDLDLAGANFSGADQALRVWENVSDCAADDIPIGLVASDGASASHVLLSWYGVGGAATYQVWRATVGGVAAPIGTSLGAATWYVDQTAQSGTAYTYWVRARVSGVWGDFSDPDQGFVAAPLAPATLAASNGTSAQWVLLSWTPVAGASWYQVWRATLTGPAAPIASTVGPVLWLLDTTASPGVTYRYWVRARVGAAWSAFSPVALGWRATLAPPAPTSLVATDGTNDAYVLLSWNASAGATQYQVWRKLIGSADASAPIGSSVNGALWFTDTTAVPGVVYRYWVRGHNANGWGPFSAPETGWRGLD